MTTLTQKPIKALDTTLAHKHAVERVVRYIRANLPRTWDIDLSLEGLCREAGYSKTYFISIFEEITGTTPHHFLAGLRIQRAKELLLYSQKSVTEISLDVGYDSFPTFSRTFGLYVGMSPTEFRRLPQSMTSSLFVNAVHKYIQNNRIGQFTSALEGEIVLPYSATGIIFVGAFNRGVPQGIPYSGTVLIRPGRFRIPRPSEATFHLLAALVVLPTEGLSPHCIPTKWVSNVKVCPGNLSPKVLKLRPIQDTDPPLVVSLTSLLSGGNIHNFG